MAQQRMMLRYARWHIWLGWLVGFPVLMWTVTGLFMVAKPIEEVRGNHLRIDSEPQALTLDSEAFGEVEGPIREIRALMQDGRPVAVVTMMDGSVRRRDMANGEAIAPLDAASARALVEQRIKGGDKVRSVVFFEADETPFDFRREMPVWQVALEDGAHIYVGRDTGQIEAVRTSWWRAFDFMWGLHIMDLQTRELDEQSPFNYAMLVIFASLAVFGSLLGCILMFRRRKARVTS